MSKADSDPGCRPGDFVERTTTNPSRASSRAAVAVEALRRGVRTRAQIDATAASLRRRATSRGSVAAAALRRLGS